MHAIPAGALWPPPLAPIAPHEATFTMINLEDGSTAPLGQIQRVAVQSKEAAHDWAEANAIQIILN